MYVRLFRDENRKMPEDLNPQAITELKIWHCKYRTLEPLKAFINLRTLIIATYPDDNLDLLIPLINLRYLRILHLPKVSDLSPLEHLKELETLSLETLPSWDASSKATEVQSLNPITKLPKLRHLQLFGVRPPDRSLMPLAECPNLTTARFHKYTKTEIKHFFEMTRIVDKANQEADCSNQDPKPPASWGRDIVLKRMKH